MKDRIMKLDKKATAGNIKFVVLDEIGEARIQSAAEELVRLVLDKTISGDASVNVTKPKVEDALEVQKEPGVTVVDSSEAAAEVARQAQIARDAGAGTGRTGGIYGIDGVRPAGEE